MHVALQAHILIENFRLGYILITTVHVQPCRFLEHPWSQAGCPYKRCFMGFKYLCAGFVNGKLFVSAFLIHILHSIFIYLHAVQSLIHWGFISYTHTTYAWTQNLAYCEWQREENIWGLLLPLFFLSTLSFLSLNVPTESDIDRHICLLVLSGSLVVWTWKHSW